MTMIDSVAPVVRIEVAPLDPEAAYRLPFALNQVFAGMLAPLDKKEKYNEVLGNLENIANDKVSNIRWVGNEFDSEVKGDLEWIRFASTGRCYRGLAAAGQSKPRNERCGFTVGLRRIKCWNRMVDEPQGSIAPKTPKGEKEVKWRSQSSNWETLVRTRSGATTLIHHREAPANRTVKAATVEPLAKGEGFELHLDLNGIAEAHTQGPSIAVRWGNGMSIVFGGNSPKARARLEVRRMVDFKIDENKIETKLDWVVDKVFNDGTPLDDSFWEGKHTLRVSRIGGEIVVDLNGESYHSNLQYKEAPIMPVTWDKAPLEVSVFGVDATFGIFKLDGFDKSGDFRSASFHRSATGPERSGNGASLTRFTGNGRLFVLPPDSTAEDGSAASVQGVATMIVGEPAERIFIRGHYLDTGAISYTVNMYCDAYSAPLLCSFSTRFPASAYAPAPEAVDVRAAVTEWEVDSGTPDPIEASQARFSLSRDMLDSFVPDWKNIVVPFRPVKISLHNSPDDVEGEVLFRGWIKPDNFDVSEYADAVYSVTCGDVISERLNEQAALIDERFNPLDLMMDGTRKQLWASECVQYIIGVVLGLDAFGKFNGNGKPLRFMLPGAPAFFNNQFAGAALSYIHELAQEADFAMPPPFGDSALSWIEKLAGFDEASFFYDPRIDALCYGDLDEFFRIRAGNTAWQVSDATITRLSNQGEFERAYNEVRVWGSDNGGPVSGPAYLMGKAGDDGRDSLDPTSKSQSWTRTLLLKPEFVKLGKVDQFYVQELAYKVWKEFENALPASYSLEFEEGFLGPRWGEMLLFQVPDEAAPALRRITKVTHRGSLSGGGSSRFSTTIEARELGGSGQ